MQTSIGARDTVSEWPMSKEQAQSVVHVVQTVGEGFAAHYRMFRALSRRGRSCFDRGDWASAREASRSQIKSYDQHVQTVVHTIKLAFPHVAEDEALWPQIKRRYSESLFDHAQPECAETFYNSVACGVLHRRYYQNAYLFFRPAISTDYLQGTEQTYRCYYLGQEGLERAFATLLRDLAFETLFEDLARDARRITHVLGEQLGAKLELNFQVHVLSAPFFRNKSAYVVGRLINGEGTHPFMLPVLRTRRGKLFVDALLMDPRSIGLVFSLARAYFMVDMEVPAAYVEFLKSVVPTKSRAEIYTVLGLQKQGKTLFYRDMQQHLAHSTDSFVLAPGQRGMVMAVFTLPSFPYVFKVIRDWFEPPKDSDRATVREKYQFVKYHDRVGRMSDTLEYSNVGFPKARFSEALLTELKRVAPSMLEEDGETLVVRHLYIERRMVPLDMYLADADEEQTRAALMDLGKAIRELTSVNIFPGDLPLKNFGVTRYGKVVFYDYDELGNLTDFNFRHLPAAGSHEEEMAAEPWYMVGPKDVFPEEFPRFLFSDHRQRALFLELHGDLTSVKFWQERQRRVTLGAEENVYPYAVEHRFRNKFGAGSSGATHASKW